jgi:hypothetical protein
VKINLLLIAVAIALTININAQQATFQKCFGGNQFEYGYSMQKTNDGGCIVGGVTASYGISTWQYYVVKFDINGNEQWTKTYGGSCGKAQPVNDLCQTADGGYVIVGYSMCTNSSGTANAYIVRTDASGDTLWTRAWGGNTTGEYSDAYEVTQTGDGNILVGGYTSVFGEGEEDAFLLKLDYNTGDTLWTRIWGGPLDEWMYYVKETNDGGIMLCGFTSSYGAGSEDVLLIKSDANGNIQWAKAYGTAGSEEGWGHCAQQTADGGYIIISSTGFLIKTDASGNITWQKQYSGPGTYTCHTVQQTTDLGYIFGGYNTVGSVQTAFLVKTDTVGNVTWSREYGDTSICYAVKQANDKGYFFTGQIQNGTGSSATDVYLVKTDTNGSSGCNDIDAGITAAIGNYIVTPVTLALHYGPQTRKVQSYVDSGYAETPFCTTVGINNLEETKTGITIYPNPVSDKINVISNQLPVNSVKIYNILGEKIYSLQITDNRSPITLNITDFTSGVYVVEVKTVKGISVEKFIKE